MYCTIWPIRSLDILEEAFNSAFYSKIGFDPFRIKLYKTLKELICAE